MRILFIKLRHIGDSLLLTPTLVATKRQFPSAEIWVLVRQSCEKILEGCPEVDRLLVTANPNSLKRNFLDVFRDIELVSLLRKNCFDYVFELTDSNRARILAVCAATKNRCTNIHPTLKVPWLFFFNTIVKKKRYPKHQVIRDYICPREVLGLPEIPPPLRFADQRMRNWDGLPEGFYAVIHCHTRWRKKTWPTAKWESLINELLQFVPNILLSCGPDDAEILSASALCSRFGERVRSTAGKTDWAQLAWLLKRAVFFVGVDTAAMHLAAASNCPTVCLFGPSPVFEYHPWNVRHWVVCPQSWMAQEDLKQISEDKLMDQIPIDRVLQCCREAWSFGLDRLNQQSPTKLEN